MGHVNFLFLDMKDQSKSSVLKNSQKYTPESACISLENAAKKAVSSLQEFIHWKHVPASRASSDAEVQSGIFIVYVK
jgi:hypothetical protein